MNLAVLKKIRVVFAIIYFTLISLLFLDLTGYFAQNLSEPLLFFQFIPSLLSFIHLLSVSAAGFIIILVLTLIFGRVYCSFLCPLGILIDFINRITLRIHKWKTGRKKRFQYTKGHHHLRFIILKIVVLLFIFGISSGIVLLDPYSNFGRLVTNFAEPVITLLNNGLSYFLAQFDNYSVPPYNVATPLLSVLLFPLLFFVLLVWLTYRNGRLYCNMICPVGSLLGAVSKISFFKLRVNKANCNSCGLCGMVCKANCIDTKNHKIDDWRCISCYNCLEACPSGGISFSVKNPNKIIENEKTDEPRRDFIKTSAVMIVGSGGLLQTDTNKIKVYKASTVEENKTFAISPPGSLSLDHFLTNCTACTLCVSACPTDVLKPSTFEYGIEGFLMPRMNNWTGFCNFECTICGDVCPNEAILPLSKEEKKLTQIGKVKFIEDNCIVHTQKTACGACSEHCPTQAVHMVKYEGKLTAPKIKAEICVGCGACEYACPTRPYKAIYVDGNEVHLKADPPSQEKLKDTNIEDFPF